MRARVHVICHTQNTIYIYKIRCKRKLINKNFLVLIICFCLFLLQIIFFCKKLNNNIEIFAN